MAPTARRTRAPLVTTVAVLLLAAGAYAGDGVMSHGHRQHRSSAFVGAPRTATRGASRRWAASEPPPRRRFEGGESDERLLGEMDMVGEMHLACGAGQLFECRQQALSSKAQIREAFDNGAIADAAACRLEMIEAENRDPLVHYGRIQQQLDSAQRRQDAALEAVLLDRLKAVKMCLPQYRLEGLWVGRKGPLAKEVIRIQYEDDDVLVATRLYDRRFINRGDEIFRANVLPDADHPEPINVDEVEDPCLKQLERFTGIARAPSDGSFDAGPSGQWMDGQLIIVGDHYFAFAWLPLNIQAFFQRVPDHFTRSLHKLENDRAGLEAMLEGADPR